MKGAQRPQLAETLEIDFYRTEDGSYSYSMSTSTLAGTGLRELEREQVRNLLTSTSSFTTGDVQDPEQASRLGYQLYLAIFSGDFHSLLTTQRAAARARGGGLRIVLRFPALSELHEAPWELLHDGTRFLALDEGTPIVRAIRSKDEAEEIAVEPPLRILFTTASSAPVNIDLEKQSESAYREEIKIRAAVNRSAGLLRLEVARGSKNRPMTLGRLRHLFLHARNLGTPFHVWHHSGHGVVTTQDGVRQFFLVLDQNDGRGDSIAPRLIHRWVSGPGDLRLAFLNLCFGGSALGLATHLAQLNVPAVIGMRSRVVNPAAVSLTATIYDALLEMPIDRAMTYGRHAMVERHWPLEWAQPIFFCRSRARLDLVPAGALSTAEQAPPELVSRFKTGIIKAGTVERYVIRSSEPGVSLPADRTTAFDTGELEADRLLEVDGVQIPPSHGAVASDLDAVLNYLTSVRSKGLERE